MQPCRPCGLGLAARRQTHVLAQDLPALGLALFAAIFTY